MIPKQHIETAKRADLPRVLKGMGIELVSNGKGYHLREHDSLKLFQQDAIWLYKWWSQGGEVGDGIQYLQRHCAMSFPEAVATLSGPIISENSTPQHVGRHDSHCPESKKKPAQWKTKSWQTESEKLIRVAQAYLFGPNGKERVSYLIDERGLHIDTIRQHQLGWLPARGQMPSKLLIPSYNSQGNLIRIRFRIDNPALGQERYRISRGSNPNLPYPLGVSSRKPVMIVESELDAILIAQEAGDHVGVLAMGTTGAKLSPAMTRYLTDRIPIILISLDNDQSGKEKTTKLMNQLPNAIDWPVPEKYGKDPGEAWKRINLRAWVDAGLRNCPTLNT
jgi:DNA primase